MQVVRLGVEGSAWPGYRVYYTQRGRQIVILLCAGDKTSQQRDIAKAKLLAQQLE